MFNPPGTVLIQEPEEVQREVIAASSSQPSSATEELAEQPPEQNRVIVNRRTSAQLHLTRTDGQQEQKKKNVTARPSYSSLRTNIIRMTPESMKCKLYCKGTKCIYCNPENWTECQQAIKGLYSNWITDEILAMARPTSRTFEEFGLIKQLKRLGIRTILNLQCAKEHDFCGPPLIAHTGFTYDPEIIMGEKVYYFNFAIPDFGTASSKSILDICKVIWFSLTYGRTAVHCHAGLGRTGTLIACFFVWSKGMSSSNAIEVVRRARPNSIQSIDQINVVEEFEFHVQKYGTALPSIFFANNGIPLRELMINQRQFLPSDEARRYAHIPKVIYLLCDRLLRKVFGKDGFQYVTPNAHHARSCTFGTIFVNWQNAFTPSGKLQVRQMVTAFARITAFPYEKDQALINHFQQLSLIKAESAIGELETRQLIMLLNAFLEAIKRPYCSRRSLIDALGHFSPDNPTVLPPTDQEEEEVEFVKMLMNPVAHYAEIDDLLGLLETNSTECQTSNSNENKCKDDNERQVDEPIKCVEAVNAAVDEQQIKMEQEIEAVIQIAERVQNDQTSEQEPETAKQNIHTSEGVHQVEQKQKSDNHEVSEAFPNPVTLQHQTLQFELPETVPKDLLEPQTIRQESVNKTELVAVHENGQVNGTEVAVFGTETLQVKEVEEAVRPQSGAAVFTTKTCAKKYGGVSIEQFEKTANEAIDGKTEKENFQSTSSSNSSQNPNGTVSLTTGQKQLEITLDNYDLHTNKSANLNADWQCVVFYVCNVISFLTGENYDTLVDLLTFWFTGDNNRDVKQAVYCHMRDLFARNMRQQEQQAAEWRRRMGHHSLKRLL
uniref:Uncharacterized protein n=1 Tax=Globodera rostochiensis TaxID=31243 RepID=A0A914IDW8_GLORO